MTDDIRRRVFEHKTQYFDSGFTAKYQIDQLVYFEELTDVRSATAREKQLKGWTRKKKMSLVEKANSHWLDLSDRWFRTEDLACKYFRESDDDKKFSPARLCLRNSASPTAG